MSRTRCLAVFGLILIMVFMSVPGGAQEPDTGNDSHRHLLTTNPFLFLFNWYNIEYELKVARHSTVGFAGSYVTFDDGRETYAGGSLLYRYYASGKAPGGFYLGGRLGMFGVEIENSITHDSEKENTYGFGIDVGYTWLLGDTRSFAISMGAGAIRYFGGDLADDAKAGMPIIRLVNIGFRF